MTRTFLRQGFAKDILSSQETFIDIIGRIEISSIVSKSTFPAIIRGHGE